MAARAIVLLSGVSSGIGLETAKYLQANGFDVYGTVRDVARVPAGLEGIRVLEMDVRDLTSIQKAVRRVIAESGRIDALINNAGVQVRGYFEDTSDREAREVFETNVFGAMALTREVLPHMRRARAGRILLIGSVGGRMGSPGLSAYCASKFALEGFGEALALEVAPLGIGVSVIEPAIIRTEIWQSNRRVTEAAARPESPYRAWFDETERMADWAVETSPTRPVDVARTIHQALRARRPKLRYLVGRRAGMVLLIKKIVPSSWFDRAYAGIVLRRILKRDA